jgi:hypothetical protein
METKTLIIPWNEFLDALEKQQPGQMQFWLRRWQFSDGGALLADQRSAAMHFPMLRWLPALARKSFARNVSVNIDETNSRSE